MTKQLVIFGTAVMTTLLALVVLWQFRIVVVYLLVSLALAATVRPLMKDWSRRSIALRVILILFYLVSLGIFGFLLFLVGRIAISEIQQLSQTVSVLGTWRLPPWLEGSSFQQVLVARLPTPDKLFEAITGEQGQLILPAVLSFTQGIGSVVSSVFVILFLSIYWTINQIHFERLWLSLLPSGQRNQARDIWRAIEPDIGTYIRNEIIQSLLAGMLLGVGYWLLGSSYPTLLALIGALVWLIPTVGGALAVVLPLLIGLLTSVQLGLVTVIYTLVVVLVLKVWVEPRIYKRRWNNPVLTLVILLAMADAFGIVGIIIAPPLSVICQILWRRLVSDRLAPKASAQVSDLKERQVQLWTAIKKMEEQPPPLMMSSMERLTQLIEKAEPILQGILPPAEAPDPFHPSRSAPGDDASPISKP
ncbi:MAG TPA: AI-2E family transporter [Anaerolineales bacterium]|nr:AI-2E family transporter [Anaerolineales bacterium]